MSSRTTPAEIVANGTAQARLEALNWLHSELSVGLLNARDSLVDCECEGSVVWLVLDALGRLGWIAEQCKVLAGDSHPALVGDAGEWMLSPVAKEAVDLVHRAA